ncbi:unnamed protein product [Sphenostylis stenocarpa]|uniref:Bifunctional inhibitor/plant lipid transfer protein/seed storage helical domain-containing protein n=1 Tax=Sphenostylis stenocarpa TaxID=92480 RepID=A0AA86SV94_9FABA|nr:unnamed protein product [Sphenostylis stenocarpa]
MMGSRVFAIMVVVAGMLLLGNLPEASAQCGDNGPPPSTQCCDQLRKIDQNCARAYADGSGINFDRAVAVSRACGIYVPPYPAPGSSQP